MVQEKVKPLFLPGSCLDSECPGLWGSILWCRSPFGEPRTRQWLQFNCLKDDVNSNFPELDTRTNELHQNVLSGTKVMVKNLKVMYTAIFLHGPHLKIFSYVGQSALSFDRLISFFCLTFSVMSSLQEARNLPWKSNNTLARVIPWKASFKQS